MELSPKEKNSISWDHGSLGTKPKYQKEKTGPIENRLVIAKEKEGRGRLVWEFEASRCKLLYIE